MLCLIQKCMSLYVYSFVIIDRMTNTMCQNMYAIILSILKHLHIIRFYKSMLLKQMLSMWDVCNIISLLVGIPVSRQTGAPITRRSSMNTPKPPPPVRRSSSITTANPQTLQRLRNTPPRQLQSTSHGQDSDSNRTSLHRRSNSSGGEPAYAELQTIQMSIHARQQLQYQPEASPYASVDTQQIAYSAPPTPSQYGNRSMPPSGHYQPPSVNQAELMQKLNAQFSALNAPYHQEDDSLPPPPPELVQVDPELPPPPSAAELEEMEKVYSTPAVQRPPPVNPKPAHPGADPSKLRASLVSELKGLRKVSNSQNDSECWQIPKESWKQAL